MRKDAASEPWISKQRPGAVVRDGVLRWGLSCGSSSTASAARLRGERAAVEQFDEREAAAAPVRTTVAAMAYWWDKGQDVARRLSRQAGAGSAG